MSEPKRVSFTTISTSASMAFGGGGNASSFMPAPASINITSTATNLRFGNDFLQDKANVSAPAGNERKNAANNNNKTVRLQLELFQTDSASYPEFNYSKLVHLEKKKVKKLKQKSNGFSDPFEENDDDVARIAEELEKKYGSTYASGRRRNKKDDHCDIGLGYDENDSFIDNTEAYDEVMPEEVETIEGGFYINCGALEFKQLHTESLKTKTDEIIKMPNRPRKRALSTSSEESSSSSDDENSDDDDEEDDSGEETVVETASKVKNASGSADKRQKVHNAGGKKNAQETDGKKQKSKTIAISCSSSNSPKPASSSHEIGSDSDKERNRQKTVKTTTIKDMLKLKRDNFLKMQGGDVKQPVNGELKGVTSKSSDEDTSSDDDSDDSSGNSDSKGSAATAEKQKNKKAANAEEKTEKLRSGDTALPELEADIITAINGFKEQVKTKNMTGKKFQFDDTLTEVFLKIDESLLCVEKTQRNMVFAHLEFHLLLPKYYFLRKAKQLRIKEEKMKSKRALGKLRKAVIETMPAVITNYGVELKKHAESQDNLTSDQPPKMPKKKFPWNSNLRNLLYDVYQVRWTSFPVLGTRKETLEEFINGYMRDKVVELWPNGWMRYEELQKEIEKRKAAAKRAKEKKKETSQPATSQTAAANTATPAVTTAISSTTATMPATNTYMKQFEEFASSSRSCANSDTESVASSSTSNSVKRKGGEKPTKRCKVQKTNGEQQQLSAAAPHTANKNQQSSSAAALDLMSPTKRTDHSIHSIISATSPPQTSGIGSNAAPAVAQSALSNAGAVNQPTKHSKASPNDTNVAVIDVDNYRSASAILQTSKQFVNVGGNVPNEVPAKITKRVSSSESDGVEIVGVFPGFAGKPSGGVVSKPKSKKNAAGSSNQASRSETPIGGGSYGMEMAGNNLYTAAMPNTSQIPGGSSNNNNSNSNNNNNNNSKKSSTNAKAFDVNQVCKMLKELEDTSQLNSQQQKVTLTTTTQNTSTKNSSNQ